MTDTITTALIAVVATIVALCLMGAWINRRADKQARRDKQHHDTALQIANGVKQRRATTPPANAGNRPDTMPIATATTTMFINNDGTTQFAIQWQNHIDPNKPVDPTGKLALAGLITGHAYYDSQIGN